MPIKYEIIIVRIEGLIQLLLFLTYTLNIKSVTKVIKKTAGRGKLPGRKKPINMPPTDKASLVALEAAE